MSTPIITPWLESFLREFEKKYPTPQKRKHFITIGRSDKLVLVLWDEESQNYFEVPFEAIESGKMVILTPDMAIGPKGEK